MSRPNQFQYQILSIKRSKQNAHLVELKSIFPQIVRNFNLFIVEKQPRNNQRSPTQSTIDRTYFGDWSSGLVSQVKWQLTGALSALSCFNPHRKTNKIFTTTLGRPVRWTGLRNFPVISTQMLETKSQSVELKERNG